MRIHSNWLVVCLLLGLLCAWPASAAGTGTSAGQPPIASRSGLVLPPPVDATQAVPVTVQAQSSENPSVVPTDGAGSPLPPGALLPVAERAGAASGKAFCRVGVGSTAQTIAAYPPALLANLRAGWYQNWWALSAPPTPNGIEFVHNVRVHQLKVQNGNVTAKPAANAPYAVPYAYNVSPSLAEIASIAAATPGSLWLLGNEIERRDWLNSGGGSQGQDEILPELYAQAYHDIYQKIKEADPTARVANGSIIAPTPLRLQYMTRVWDEYLRRYNTTMPVDVWNIHLYMLQEVRNQWGIDIPAGIEGVTEGMYVFGGDPYKQRMVNKDFSLVPGLIADFRRWMADRGERNKPLVISEFGVLLPDWVWPGEFTPERVRDEYMVPALQYLMNTTDANLGYPADENRPVQGVNWYSLDGDDGHWKDSTSFQQNYNGNLLWSGLQGNYNSPHLMGLTPLGTYWSNYLATLPETVNLRPLALSPFVPTSNGNAVTGSVRVRVGNSGQVDLDQPFQISFYDEANHLIGSQTINALRGCAAFVDVQITWPNVTPGRHTVRAVVDSASQIVETREDDNQMSSEVLVSGNRVHLPITRR